MMELKEQPYGLKYGLVEKGFSRATEIYARGGSVLISTKYF